MGSQHGEDLGRSHLERRRDACKRTAGSGRRHKCVDAAAGLFPDLRTGRSLVGEAVRGILELIRPKCAGRLLRDPARDVMVLRVCENSRGNNAHVRTVGAQKIDLLLGLVVRGRRSPFYPRSFATSASAMPVLPAVPSTIVPPGRSMPRDSASSTMPRAARSFTEPPGLRNSAFPNTRRPSSVRVPCR